MRFTSVFLIAGRRQTKGGKVDLCLAGKSFVSEENVL